MRLKTYKRNKFKPSASEVQVRFKWGTSEVSGTYLTCIHPSIHRGLRGIEWGMGKKWLQSTKISFSLCIFAPCPENNFSLPRKKVFLSYVAKKKNDSYAHQQIFVRTPAKQRPNYCKQCRIFPEKCCLRVSTPWDPPDIIRKTKCS